MEKELFLFYYNQGFSDTKISSLVNKERHFVGDYRKSLNLPRASFVTLYGDEIIKFVNKGFPDIKIAEELGISSSMIGYVRKRLKIKTKFTQKTYLSKEDRIKGYMIRNIKHSAKRRNLDFNLECEDIILPKYCPLLNVELNYTNYTTHKFLGLGEEYVDLGFNAATKASIDRVDNTKGYVKGNILIISRLANAMKNEANFEQLETFSQNIIKIINFYKNHGALGNVTDIFFNNEKLSLDS